MSSSEESSTVNPLHEFMGDASGPSSKLSLDTTRLTFEPQVPIRSWGKGSTRGETKLEGTELPRWTAQVNNAETKNGKSFELKPVYARLHAKRLAERQSQAGFFKQIDVSSAFWMLFGLTVGATVFMAYYISNQGGELPSGMQKGTGSDSGLVNAFFSGVAVTSIAQSSVAAIKKFRELGFDMIPRSERLETAISVALYPVMYLLALAVSFTYLSSVTAGNKEAKFPGWVAESSADGQVIFNALMMARPLSNAFHASGKTFITWFLRHFYYSSEQKVDSLKKEKTELAIQYFDRKVKQAIQEGSLEALGSINGQLKAVTSVDLSDLQKNLVNFYDKTMSQLPSPSFLCRAAQFVGVDVLIWSLSMAMWFSQTPSIPDGIDYAAESSKLLGWAAVIFQAAGVDTYWESFAVSVPNFTFAKQYAYDAMDQFLWTARHIRNNLEESRFVEWGSATLSLGLLAFSAATSLVIAENGSDGLPNFLRSFSTVLGIGTAICAFLDNFGGVAETSNAMFRFLLRELFSLVKKVYQWCAGVCRDEFTIEGDRPLLAWDTTPGANLDRLISAYDHLSQREQFEVMKVFAKALNGVVKNASLLSDEHMSAHRDAYTYNDALVCFRQQQKVFIEDLTSATTADAVPDVEAGFRG